MRFFKILFLYTSFISIAQKNYPLKWKAELSGVFEVVKIDSTKIEYQINLKMKYLSNKQDFKNNLVPEEYFALLISQKPTSKKISNKKIYKKLQVGKEYYFNLKHYYFCKSMHPAPSSIPYAYGEWPDYIWREESDFGIYETEQLIGVFYKD